MFGEGNTLFQKKEFSAAISKYTEALKLFQRHSYFGMRAQALLRKVPPDASAALQDATQAVKLNPHDYRGYLFKANAQEALGREAEALLSVSQGLKIKPGEQSLLDTQKRLTHNVEKMKWIPAYPFGLKEKPSRCAPFDSFFSARRLQAIYLASDIRSSLEASKLWRGEYMDGTIDFLQMKCVKPGVCSHLDFQIMYSLISPGTRFHLTNATWIPATKCVYGPATIYRHALRPNQWVTFPLGAEMHWDGISDILIQFSYHGREPQKLPVTGAENRVIYDDRSFGLTGVVACQPDRILTWGRERSNGPLNNNWAGSNHTAIPCLHFHFRELNHKRGKDNKRRKDKVSAEESFANLISPLLERSNELELD